MTVNRFRFWSDRMLQQYRLEQLARLSTMQKLAEKGYDVSYAYEEVETELLEIVQEVQRREALPAE